MLMSTPLSSPWEMGCWWNSGEMLLVKCPSCVYFLFRLRPLPLGLRVASQVTSLLGSWFILWLSRH